MKIPNYDPYITNSDIRYIKKCIQTRWVSSSGSFVKTFEKRISTITKSKYALAVVNGTSALQLAIRTLNPKKGDEILVPTISFIASVNSIIYNNCSPVFMDVSDDYNIDINKLENFLKKQTVSKNGVLKNKITNKKILAVLAVSVWGNPISPKLKYLADKFKIKLIEDAAESFGSYYKKNNKKIHSGTLGVSGCLSFNGNKIITSGGGGALITNNKKIYLKARYLSEQAKDDKLKWVHNDIGYNFRISNLHAALGLSQIDKLKRNIKKKKIIHNYLSKKIDKINGFHIFKYSEYSLPNYWMNILKLGEKNSKKINAIVKDFFKNQIEVRYLWHPCHLQKMYTKYQKYNIKNAVKLLKSTILLPSGSTLTRSDCDKIYNIVKKFE